LWEKRKTLGTILLSSEWRGLPVLIVAVLLSLYGILGSSGNIAMPSVPLMVLLITLFCFGAEAVKRLSMPLGFLFFMVPVPGIIERHVGLYLKNISTSLGGSFIALCNIPVNVSGNIIDLGVTQLQVVDACSGMRYIFPLLALGVLYAHFFERALWKRTVCILATIPLGILFNALRIGITGVLTDCIGPQVAQGFFHDLSGWVIFVFALIMLFVISLILKRFPPRRGNEQPSRSETFSTVIPAEQSKGTTPAFLVSGALLLTVAAFSLSTSTLPPVTIKGGIESLPLRMGAWQGSTETVDQVLVRESGAEQAFSGNFTGLHGDAVSLYVGYRGTAFLADENFFHSPTVCIPFSGWVEHEVKTRTITGVPHFGSFDVTSMVIEKEGVRQLVYFWFQTKRWATPDKTMNRFHLSLHALRRDNTYDLFLRPITQIRATERIEDAEQRLDGFVRDLMPMLLQYLKEKQITT
jgi:exosortase D (VPLPA-CTERM-specific)